MKRITMMHIHSLHQGQNQILKNACLLIISGFL